MAEARPSDTTENCLCENPAKYCCNTCGDKLCSNCRKSYTRNRLTSHHAVVPYGDDIVYDNFSDPTDIQNQVFAENGFWEYLEEYDKCLCEYPAMYFCKTCTHPLCSRCNETHVRSNSTSRHKVIPYSEKGLVKVFCTTHGNQEGIYWCNGCRKAACNACFTSIHRNHWVTKFETIPWTKRGFVERKLAALETNILRQWEDTQTRARQIITYYEDETDKVDRELDDRAIAFHNKIDRIIHQSKIQLREIKTSNLVKLWDQEKIITDGLDNIKEEIRQYDEQLRFGNLFGPAAA